MASVLLTFAGKTDKAFEALKIHDYFRAKDIFEKALKSDPMLANYGLSIIFSRNNNPFYSLDSASACIDRSELSYKDIKVKDRKKIFDENGVDLDTILAQKQNIASLAFSAAKKENTVPAIEYVIQKYPFSAEHAKVIAYRDSLAYSIAEKQNTWMAYKSFVNSYPSSPLTPQASAMYEKLLFEQSTKDKTPEQYFAFVSAYPQSPYATEAHEKLYELSTPEKTLEQYSAFVRLYPDSPYSTQAWQAISRLWFTDYSQGEIASFKAAFPRSPILSQIDAAAKAASIKYFPILSKDKTYGFVASTGVITVKPKYDFVDDFSFGAAMVGMGDKITYIDTQGKTLAPFTWEDGNAFCGELAIVSIDDMLGVINKAGGTVLPCRYDNIYFDKTSLILTEKSGVFRYYSRIGTPLFHDYTHAKPFKNGKAVVTQDGTAQLINSRGDILLSGEYKDIRIGSDSLLFVQNATDESWSITDHLGAAISTRKYEQVGDFSAGMAVVVYKGKYGYINEKGKEIIPANMSFTGEIKNLAFQGQRAKTSYRDKYGMIDENGKRLVPNLFDDIKPSESWPVPIQKNGLWGYVGKSVSISIPCTYDAVEPFTAGRAIVVKKGMWGIINAKGTILVPFEYSNIEPLSGGDMFIVAKNGKTGIINAEGKVILPIEYDRLREYSPNVLQVVLDGEFLYFDISAGKYIYKGL
ncbi:MAG: WG repeat-containing protein [Flavobacteriales bacterium]|nr:WG repeat-containing protein [Flavobacteriales bacterium]